MSPSIRPPTARHLKPPDPAEFRVRQSMGRTRWVHSEEVASFRPKKADTDLSGGDASFHSATRREMNLIILTAKC